MHMQIGFDLNL